VRKIEAELAAFGGDLQDKERWLVLNKCDLLDADALRLRQAQLLDALGWQAPVYTISALTGDGTGRLMQDLMRRLEQLKVESGAARPADEPDTSEWHPLD
jgi:GTP-binding protein